MSEKHRAIEQAQRKHQVANGENGYNESFKEIIRDELLNGEIFTTLKEVQRVTERWRREYIEFRPYLTRNYKLPVPSAILPKVQIHIPLRLTYWLNQIEEAGHSG